MHYEDVKPLKRRGRIVLTLYNESKTQETVFDPQTMLTLFIFSCDLYPFILFTTFIKVKLLREYFK